MTRSSMALIPQAEVSDLFPTVQQEVARLAAAPEVRSAYNWFRSQEPQLAHWQVEVARIPAPPFGEVGARGLAGGALSRSGVGRCAYG